MLAAGVGALLGGLVTPWLGRRLGRVRALTAGAATTALAIGAMGFVANGYLAGGLFALCAAGVMVWNVLTMSLRQALIPEHMFGRVQGAYRTVVWGAIPVGALAGGAVASLLGVAAVFVVSGAGLLVLAGVLWRLLRAHAAELTDEALAPPEVPRPV